MALASIVFSSKPAKGLRQHEVVLESPALECSRCQDDKRFLQQDHTILRLTGARLTTPPACCIGDDVIHVRAWVVCCASMIDAHLASVGESKNVHLLLRQLSCQGKPGKLSLGLGSPHFQDDDCLLPAV